MQYSYILTCPHNTAQIAKKELDILGYKASIQSSTVLHFTGDEEAIARVNLNSRIGNKLFLILQQGRVSSFEDLFSLVQNIDWANYITPNQPFTITALSKKNPLTSTPTIQSITKKSILKKLLGDTETRWEEDTSLSPIEIEIILDDMTGYVLLNTTGRSLHNRGYRQHTGDAPLKENLAAALVLSSGRKFSTALIDPFCGAGTICIEATLIAKNIAPGLIRLRYSGFAFQHFSRYNQQHLEAAKQTAENKIIRDKDHTILGYDADETMIEITRDNARNAGVDNYIEFKKRDFITERELHMLNGSIVTNPPYGERMKPEDLEEIYAKLISLYEKNTTINGGFITSIADTLDLIDPKLWKQTLYYNGPLECRFFKIARL